MDGLLPIIIVIFTIISIVNSVKKKNQQDSQKSEPPQANNKQAVNPDIGQFFGFKDTLNFFEQQFAQSEQKDVSLSEGYFPDTVEPASLESQDIAFTTPLIRGQDTATYGTAKTDMNLQFESSSPVYAYDLAPEIEHDYEAFLKGTAIDTALLNLFSNKSEITRAVIYSEIFRPKFKRM